MDELKKDTPIIAVHCDDGSKEYFGFSYNFNTKESAGFKLKFIDDRERNYCYCETTGFILEDCTNSKEETDIRMDWQRKQEFLLELKNKYKLSN